MIAGCEFPKCRWCSGAITVKRKGPKVWCSDACKAKEKKFDCIEREMRSKTLSLLRRYVECEHCGNGFIRKCVRVRHCSPECARLNRPPKRKTKNCLTCASEFEVPIHKFAERKFCSLQCAGEHKKESYLQDEYQKKIGKLDRERRVAEKRRRLRILHKGWKCCIWCGKAYSRSHGVYCSRKCCRDSGARKARERAKEDYYRRCPIKRFKCEMCRQTYDSRSSKRKFCPLISKLILERHHGHKHRRSIWPNLCRCT